ncbi:MULTISPECIES: VOC family protein [Actinoalloteichus]|nr:MULTISPECIES: VOC family protein [Actinoalloteichus]
MNPMIFVNLPVKDLGRATTFYQELGFTRNPQFSDENASCMVISDAIYVMLLVEPFFSTFTTKPVADATRSTETILALSAEDRAAVDRLADAALAAGGVSDTETMDEGSMYLRGFQDLDGHQWEVTWMDMSAAQ